MTEPRSAAQAIRELLETMIVEDDVPPWVRFEVQHIEDQMRYEAAQREATTSPTPDALLDA